MQICVLIKDFYCLCFFFQFVLSFRYIWNQAIGLLFELGFVK